MWQVIGKLGGLYVVRRSAPGGWEWALRDGATGPVTRAVRSYRDLLAMARDARPLVWQA